ncbi:winged helix-turn-helix domain-containing protein [Plantactinospora sp. KLBMP9567]|uniref:winged helix-turn-helix domain-containing protein n=1 Tax=Plantactinospora sp. KLBMP9567 TaxID=3085900 RepID=UPI00298293F2|nr:helix-turn-helix domain-containing protein [Plantactinospora sp. KLBMP9567]MDW5328089.1 helix-turn-helix domain-containing protein [Plantactinospora sp. KLBMP9567]
MSPPRSEIRLTDPRALRGYAHPLRMALVGLLRREGPLTATQAAERLDESVPSCSYHLRQLAKYGLAERVEGSDARERPWRATALNTSWDDTSDDPALLAAVNELHSVILNHYFERARAHLAQRASEPADWRAVLGFGDALVHVTQAELAELTRRIEALFAEYDERLTDPSTRPEGSRPVGIIQLMVPTEPPADATAAGSTTADADSTARADPTDADSTAEAGR